MEWEKVKEWSKSDNGKAILFMGNIALLIISWKKILEK